MAAVANDWTPRVPRDKPHDRHNLALFLAPTPDPDLLVPGPLVQPTGGIAYYPNGEAIPADRGGGLLLSFTQAGIHACRVETLPDPDRPCLVPRGGRSPAVVADDRVTLHHHDSSVAVLPPRAAVTAERATLCCTLRLDRYSGSPTTLMTLDSGGEAISLLAADTDRDDRLMIRAGGATHDLGPLELGRDTDVRIDLAPHACRIDAAGGRREMPSRHAFPRLAFGNSRPVPPSPMPPSGVMTASFSAIRLT